MARTRELKTIPKDLRTMLSYSQAEVQVQLDNIAKSASEKGIQDAARVVPSDVHSPGKWTIQGSKWTIYGVKGVDIGVKGDDIGVKGDDIGVKVDDTAYRGQSGRYRGQRGRYRGQNGPKTPKPHYSTANGRACGAHGIVRGLDEMVGRKRPRPHSLSPRCRRYLVCVPLTLGHFGACLAGRGEARSATSVLRAERANARSDRRVYWRSQGGGVRVGPAGQ
eukprot:8568789-Pyramimonas_sp.AAC.1